jgi:hypothetical protein
MKKSVVKKHAKMAPLVARYKVLSLYPDADVLAVRDADSPPTRADVTAINAWRTSCAETHPVMTYRLPLYGCERCGGGMTFHRPGQHCHLQRLDSMEKDSKANQKKTKSAWGVDEHLVDALVMQVQTCRVDCFHDPCTMIYFTSPSFEIPVIDRIDDECGSECHWNLISQPPRARKRRKTDSRYPTKLKHCKCWEGKHVSDAVKNTNVEAVASRKRDRIILYSRQHSKRTFATYTPTMTNPSRTRMTTFNTS